MRTIFQAVQKQAWLLMLLMLSTCSLQARDLPDFTELVADAAPAVVNISTLKKSKPQDDFGPNQRLFEEFEGTPFYEMFRHFWGELGPGGSPDRDVRSLGSGFIIDAAGFIITNRHVIEGADEVIVRLNDRRELVAKVVGADKDSDIALLKVEAKDLPRLKLANSNELKVGEWVVAIGSPFGFDHSVTAGIVSAKGRSFGQERYVPFIQTDVAINPGNSGGPLLNLEGEVVGVNSHIITRSGQFGGLSFAIPSNIVKNIVEQIREHGKVTRGWLGLMFQEVNRELAESFGLDKPHGALIAKVLEDSPAEKAGLKRGDVIIEFNDQDVKDAGALPPLVGQVKPGERIKLKIFRDGKAKTVQVTIGKAPDAKADEEALPETKPMHGNKLGMIVRELETAEKPRLEEGIKGLLVVKVKRNIIRAGIRPGDILISVNNKNMASMADFNAVVKGVKTNQTVPILIYRPGMGQRYVAVKIGTK